MTQVEVFSFSYTRMCIVGCKTESLLKPVRNIGKLYITTSYFYGRK